MQISRNVSLSHGGTFANGLLPLALHLVTLIGERPALTPQDIRRPDLFKGCNYNQKVPIGQPQYIYSHGYDSGKTFPGGIVCRWNAESPEKSRLELNCLDFKVGKMDHSRICTSDRFLVSPTGDTAMTDAEMHCGEKAFKIKSVGNKMLLLFFSDYEKNPSDRFLCSLKAVPHKTCDCGRWNKRYIHRGIKADNNEFPMMAGLVLQYQRILFCGAQIISRRYAITAAHCIEGKDPDFVKMQLLVGGHNSSNFQDTPYAKLYEISKVFIHPRYETVDYQDDIALLKVGYTDQDGIQFNKKVGPVCLPFNYLTESFIGKPVILAGWGITVRGEPGPQVLQEAYLSVVPLKSCIDIYRRKITYRQICAHREGVGPCLGDSGGPLLWLDETTDRLHTLGVISFKMGCNHPLPFVSTRITSYLNWIVLTTNEEFCRP